MQRYIKIFNYTMYVRKKPIGQHDIFLEHVSQVEKKEIVEKLLSKEVPD